MARLINKTIRCEYCGCNFHPNTKRHNQPPQRFCSVTCGRRARPITHPEVRFWAKVKKAGPNDCWEWTASTDRFGYGAFGLTSRSILKAHRYAWELGIGPLAEGDCLLHSCDNPKCVNVAHLRIGTRSENAQDRVMRNRVPVGENSANSKLTIEEVKAIRRDTRLQSAIAKEFDIDQSQVSLIKSGKAWAKALEQS